MTNLYVDRTTFKDRQGITGTGDDEEVLVRLEDLSRAIDEYCNRFFYVKTETRYFNGAGLTLLLDRDLISITALKTDDDNDGTYETTWAGTDYITLPYSGACKHALAVDRRTQGTKADFSPGIQRAVEVAGKWGYSEKTVASGATINDAGGISASDTAVTVSDGTKYAVGQTILIESEQMYVSAIAANTLTITRGVNGTTAASHADGLAISRYQYPRPIVEALLVMAGQAWGRRKLVTQSPAPSGSIVPLQDVTPDARPLLAPFRRLAFAAV